MLNGVVACKGTVDASSCYNGFFYKDGTCTACPSKSENARCKSADGATIT